MEKPTMNFTIPCETFFRLTHVLKNTKPGETADYLKSVYLENHEGKAFAIATNRKVAAIEFLGETTEPNGSVNITIDPALVKQCETEKSFNGIMYVHFNEMLNFATVKTQMGYNFPGNAAVNPGKETEFQSWRKWFPDAMPKKPNGATVFGAEWIANLGRSSPSGEIVFPTVIDCHVPVLVRDLHDPKWFGLFMPEYAPGGNVVDVEPVSLPDWLS